MTHFPNTLKRHTESELVINSSSVGDDELLINNFTDKNVSEKINTVGCILKLDADLKRIIGKQSY